MTKYTNLTIIIPTLNEEKNIIPLIKDLEKMYDGINILVCDDGSKDKTQSLIKKYYKDSWKSHLLDRSNKKTKGLTISVLDGIKATKTKYFIVIDGDRQHPIETISKMHELLKNNLIVIGQRIEIKTEWPIERRIMSFIATQLAHSRLYLNGVHVKDPMSGFFGMETNLAKKIIQKKYNYFEHRGYKVLFDMLKIIPKKTTIAQAGYVFGGRQHGTSKIGKRHILLFLKSLFK